MIHWNAIKSNCRSKTTIGMTQWSTKYKTERRIFVRAINTSNVIAQLGYKASLKKKPYGFYDSHDHRSTENV